MTVFDIVLRRTKLEALEAYKAWKIGQIDSIVQRWQEDNCSDEEVERRISALNVELETEVNSILRAVTIHCLKREF